ncbi:MAG: cupin domain-containing protein [Dehalococcoidia bacterium]
MSTPIDVVVVGTGEGQHLVGGTGVPVQLKVREATGGAYALLESTLAAGGPMPLPHVHHVHEEALYVIAGELSVQAAARTLVAPAGTFILIPRGTLHTFRNSGTQEARYLILVSPPGLEGMWEEFVELRQAAPTGQVDFDTIRRTGLKYDTEFIVPPGA